MIRVPGAEALLRAAGFSRDGDTLTIPTSELAAALRGAGRVLTALETAFSAAAAFWEGDCLGYAVKVHERDGVIHRVDLQSEQGLTSLPLGKDTSGRELHAPLVSGRVGLSAVGGRLVAEGRLCEIINKLVTERDKRILVQGRSAEEVTRELDELLDDTALDRDGTVRFHVVRALYVSERHPTTAAPLTVLTLHCDSCGNRKCASGENCEDAHKNVPLDAALAEALRTPLRALFARCGVPHNLGRWPPMGWEGDNRSVGTKERHRSQSVPALWYWENKAKASGERFSWVEPTQKELEEEMIRQLPANLQKDHHATLLSVILRDRAAQSHGRRVELPELREIAVAGDGHCQFRAIARIVYGSEGRHTEVRREVCRHLRERQRAFGGSMDPSFAAMLGSMEGGDWGNEYTLLAAADLYRRELAVVTSRGLVNYYRPREKPPTRTDFLSLHEVPGFEHYNCLVGPAEAERAAEADVATLLAVACQAAEAAAAEDKWVKERRVFGFPDQILRVALQGSGGDTARADVVLAALLDKVDTKPETTDPVSMGGID